MKHLCTVLILFFIISCTDDPIEPEPLIMSDAEIEFVGDWMLDSTNSLGYITVFGTPACQLSLLDVEGIHGYWKAYGEIYSCNYANENIWFINPDTGYLNDRFEIITISDTHIELYYTVVETTVYYTKM
jgi:hypothetical protein